MAEQFYTLKDLAELLRVSERTIQRWRRNDKFPHPIELVPGSGKKRWTERAISEWQRECQEPAEAAR